MSREEIEKFLTAEGHAKVEQFMADAADEDDEVDMDEVVRRNLADHAAVLHGPTDTNTGEAAGRAQHPDDAAVAEVRAWLGGLDDEAQVQFKVCKLRGVLNVLDGWERAARGAADQRNAAELRLETAKVDMRMLRDEGKRLRADLRTTNIRARTAEIAWSRQQNIIEAERRRAETAERELAEMRAKHQPGPNLHAWRRPDGYRVHGDDGRQVPFEGFSLAAEDELRATIRRVVRDMGVAPEGPRGVELVSDILSAVFLEIDRDGMEDR